MAHIEYISASHQELQRIVNQAIEQVAWHMVQDGVIDSIDQVTNRYLAVVVQKGYIARMFDSWFKKEEENSATKIAVIRVDSSVKSKDNE